eukprot:Lankesteria_metandrocarpae@DN2341_c0_g1_i4.p1
MGVPITKVREGNMSVGPQSFQVQSSEQDTSCEVWMTSPGQYNHFVFLCELRVNNVLEDRSLMVSDISTGDAAAQSNSSVSDFLKTRGPNIFPFSAAKTPKSALLIRNCCDNFETVEFSRFW